MLEFADGSKRSDLILGKGIAKLPLIDVTRTLRIVILKDALYIPSFTRNIMSLRQAVRDHAKFDFNVIGQEQMICPNGFTYRITSVGNLYTLHIFTVNNIVSRTADQWHRVCGHTNLDYIHKMPHCIDNMKIICSKTKNICQPCVLGKMHR